MIDASEGGAGAGYLDRRAQAAEHIVYRREGMLSQLLEVDDLLGQLVVLKIERPSHEGDDGLVFCGFQQFFEQMAADKTAAAKE